VAQFLLQTHTLLPVFNDIFVLELSNAHVHHTLLPVVNDLFVLELSNPHVHSVSN
jgi:hypothetical protein